MLNLNKFILKSDFSIRRIRPRTTAIKIERKIMSNILNRINVFRKDRTVASSWCLCSLNRFLALRMLTLYFLDFVLIRCYSYDYYFPYTSIYSIYERVDDKNQKEVYEKIVKFTLCSSIAINIVYLIMTIKIVTVSEVLFKYQNKCLRSEDRCLKSKTELFFYHLYLFLNALNHYDILMSYGRGSVPNAIRETHSEYINLINSTFVFANLFISLTSSLTSKNLSICFLTFFGIIAFFMVVAVLVHISEFDIVQYYSNIRIFDLFILISKVVIICVFAIFLEDIEDIEDDRIQFFISTALPFSTI